MSALDKLKLLIWKNFLLQKRHKWQTVFEILSPVIFSTFLILIRCIVDPKHRPGIDYPPFQPTYFNLSGPLMTNLTKGTSNGTIAFSPDTPLTRKVIKNAMMTVASENVNIFFSLLLSPILPEPKGFKNAKEMQTALTQHNAMKSIFLGIQFNEEMSNATTWPDDIKLTLRFPAVMRTPMVEHPLRASWRTNLLFPIFPKPGPREPDDMHGGKLPGYSPEMFLAIQHAVSQAIIKEKSGKNINTKVYLQRMPQLPYREDDLLVALERFISMIVMLCFAYTFVNTVRAVTQEKELQLKETMNIMGLQSWLHWLAWFIKQITYSLVSVILLVILLKTPFKKMSNGEGYAVLTFTPFTVLLFFLFLFVVASLAFCFMVSAFFSRANTAASFMGLAWFMTYSVYMLTQGFYEEISLTTKLLLSLISNTAMGFAFQMIVATEGTFEGLHWNKFFTSVSYHDKFTPGHIAIMLMFDTFLYMIIAMYIEKIKPGTYGVPLPWYFPFTKSFWAPKKPRVGVITNETDNAEYSDSLLRVVHDEEPVGVPLGVDIRNLTKVYKGKKKAVDNLNFRMYENEITVLLGHNGAGKTTTISMMTGMVPPTSGTVIINGHDIVTATEEARKSIGICPQHNVLFPDLTVAEHIIFYARLKGVPKNRINSEVDHFVKLLELEPKRDVLSKHLSGGQQRRLSVGAAMCGSSRVVLLDEPTSGLDPSARRALWDLLQKEKKGRAMILTTHFMDEADVLADRIAIMSGGRLQCIGTPYFLKKHYGLGYKLTIVKQENCTVTACTEFLSSYVPNVAVNTDIGSELTYILPTKYVNIFPNLLKDLEERKESLGISSYGLSITSLEEVFMSAGAENFGKRTSEITNDSVSSKRNESLSAASPQFSKLKHIEKVRGPKLLKNHIRAMFLKLAYSAMRNKLQNLIQFISPIVNITVSVLVARSWKFISELPPLIMTLSVFKKTQTLMSHVPSLLESSTENDIMHSYKDYFLHSGDRHMALIDIGNRSLPEYYKNLSHHDLARVRYETLVGATFAPGNITAWFSNYGYHDSAISLAVANNAIMKALAPNATLTVINHPLPYSIENLVKLMAAGNSIGFQFAFNIGFCMAFVAAFIVLFVIKERRSGAKLLQRVSGVQPAVMWGCALLWDWVWLLLINLCVVATLAAYQEYTFSTPSELGRVLLVLMAYSFAIIPIHYLASFYFEAAATGFSKMCFVNIFTGCMPFLITEVLRIPGLGNPYYAKIFDGIFSPLPLYCLSRSFRDMSVSSFAIIACDALCHQYVNIRNCTRDTICHDLKVKVCCIEEDPFLKWQEPGVGRYLFVMAVVGLLGFAFLLMKEYELFSKAMYLIVARQTPPTVAREEIEIEDSDVATERAYVRSLTRDEIAANSLVCTNLTKFYKSLLAVDRLTFVVRKGDCFGLLGINGAGKTTTFKMLTGDTRVTHGDALVLGYSIKTEPEEVHRNIGYCPQFDGLLDNLTGRETLRIYCLLRGIPSEIGKESATQLAKSLGFLRHFDKKVYEYSGGTKRKLSTALALMGDASLVYLDEPTTGMDPASKRLVWSCVSEAVRIGRSVVLTSHSMEECEALCSRLTIMVNGRLNCLGTLQHLKNKFSHGYTLVVKCKPVPEREETMKALHEYIAGNFHGSKLIETYLGICTYYLSDVEVTWWQVFYTMERAKTTLAIDDYSVTQTTLEQVFIGFTKDQKFRENGVRRRRKQSILSKLKRQLCFK